MKNLATLSTDDLRGLYQHLLGAGLPILTKHRKLSVWTEDLGAALHMLDLAATTPAPAPAPSAPARSGKELDQRAESAVRVMANVIKLREQVALAQDEDPQPWVDLYQNLFPKGLGFLGDTYLGQVGAVRALVLRARDPQVLAQAAQLSALGKTWEELVDRIEANNQDLAAHIAAPDPAINNQHVARNQALALLTDLVPIIDRVLPESDPTLAAERALLLQPLR